MALMGYFLNTSASNVYQFGAIRLEGISVPGQFRLCINGDGPINWVLYLEGTRYTGVINTPMGCTPAIVVGATGDFQVYASRAVIFGTPMNFNYDYALWGFTQP